MNTSMLPSILLANSVTICVFGFGVFLYFDPCSHCLSHLTHFHSHIDLSSCSLSVNWVLPPCTHQFDIDCLPKLPVYSDSGLVCLLVVSHHFLFSLWTGVVRKSLHNLFCETD